MAAKSKIRPWMASSSFSFSGLMSVAVTWAPSFANACRWKWQNYLFHSVSSRHAENLTLWINLIKPHSDDENRMENRIFTVTVCHFLSIMSQQSASNHFYDCSWWNDCTIKHRAHYIIKLLFWRAKWQILNRPHTTRYILMPSDPDDLRDMQTPLYLNSSTLPQKKGITGRAMDQIMTQSPQGCARGLVNLKGVVPCLGGTKPVDCARGSLWMSRTTIGAMLFTARSRREHPQWNQKAHFCTTTLWWMKVWTMCA